MLSLADLLVQPNPRRRPMPLHRGWRHAQNISSLFDGKPSEKSKLDDSALLRVEFGQAIEGSASFPLPGESACKYRLTEPSAFVTNLLRD